MVFLLAFILWNHCQHQCHYLHECSNVTASILALDCCQCQYHDIIACVMVLLPASASQHCCQHQCHSTSITTSAMVALPALQQNCLHHGFIADISIMMSLLASSSFITPWFHCQSQCHSISVMSFHHFWCWHPACC